MKELHGLIKDSEDLSKFFNDERFKSILKKDESGRVLMKPLPPPEKLKNAIKDPIIDNPEFTINIDEHTDFQNLKLWNKTDLWQHYCGSGGENVPKNILSYFSEQLDLDKISDRPRIGDIWWRFLHRVSYDRRFLLYAQRSIMKDWFDWFDPTLPDQIRDHNRPWDYDHILPYSWAHHETKIKSEIKHLVRLWVNVNGNLRVWPLELNRSKGNGGIVEECINEYGLMNIKSVCSASFIKGEGAEWRAIESKVREGMVPNSEGNKFFREQGNHWKVFIEASMDRTVDIYKEWYDKLLIRELMK